MEMTTLPSFGGSHETLAVTSTSRDDRDSTGSRDSTGRDEYANAAGVGIDDGKMRELSDQLHALEHGLRNLPPLYFVDAQGHKQSHAITRLNPNRISYTMVFAIIVFVVLILAVWTPFYCWFAMLLVFYIAYRYALFLVGRVLVSGRVLPFGKCRCHCH